MKRKKKAKALPLRDRFGRFKSRKRKKVGTKKAPPKKRAPRKPKAPKPPPPPPRQVHLIPYFILDNHLALLKSYGYTPRAPISVSARTKTNQFIGARAFRLPARFGWKEDWTEWRRKVRQWMRDIKAQYADAVIE